MSNTNDKQPQKLSYGIAFRVGGEFISGIFVGIFFGYMVDSTFNTKPWGMIIFILLGAAAGIRNIFRLVALSEIKLNSDNSKENRSTDD